MYTQLQLQYHFILLFFNQNNIISKLNFFA